jgi:hypothetical protein
MTLPFTIPAIGLSKIDVAAIAALTALLAAVAYQSPNIVVPWINTDFIVTSLEDKSYEAYKNNMPENQHLDHQSSTDATDSTAGDDTEAAHGDQEIENHSDHTSTQRAPDMLSDTAETSSNLTPSGSNKRTAPHSSAVDAETPTTTAEVVELLKSLKNNTSNPILSQEVTGSLVALFLQNPVAVNLLCQDLIASPSTEDKSGDTCSDDDEGNTEALDFRARNTKALDTFEAITMYYLAIIHAAPLDPKQPVFLRQLRLLLRMVRPALRVMLDNFVRDGRIVLFDSLDITSSPSNLTGTSTGKPINAASLDAKQKQDYLLYRKAHKLYTTKWS